MTPSPTPSVCSFAEIDPYAFGPTAVPLHPPPPRLPEDVMACGGRLEPPIKGAFAVPAITEDLLAIHLQLPKRLSVKLDRWFHADSVPGDFTLIPREILTTWNGGEGAEALVLSLPPTFTRKTALQDTNYAPTFLEFMPRVGHTDPLVHAIGRAVLNELQTGGLLGALYLESLFRTLAIHLLRNHAVFAKVPTPVNGKLPPVALQRVRDYVHAHLSEEITLEALAALVHLSPYHFARKFKAATGLPPYQYVLHCRVEQAKTLLVAGKHSISEVAQAVGFASQSHLTRHIKHAFGVTPGALLPVGKAGVK